jgi:tetratricopeptide (TPR) repeat protein
MPTPGRKASEQSPLLALLAERPQLDFELEFFEHLLHRIPDFTDVLRAQARNLTLKGRLKDGLRVDKTIVRLLPRNPTAHYNLACRYALLKQAELALHTLRRAVELGYRDFQYIAHDADLDSIRTDPRFSQLLREFAKR